MQANLIVNPVRLNNKKIFDLPVYNPIIMKRVLLILLCLVLPCLADNYNVHTNGAGNLQTEQDEKILFILDFSNSMTEYLDGRSKLDMMLATMREIIPKIPKNTAMGLRVYGHKMGFTAFDACRATSLVSPIAQNSGGNILYSLSDIKPKGMTPITYSLKQAVKNDFLGFSGKKHIILLTDGGENCDESPCTYAMELIKVRKDIKIDVIAFNIKDEDDLAQLECASLVTSGKFYTANTAAELINSLNNSLNIKKDVEAKIFFND